MNVMLLSIFAAIAFGLFGRRFAHREMRVMILIATAMTLVYFLHPLYMT